MQVSIKERSRALADGVLRMQAFDEQFRAFLSSLQRMADRCPRSTSTDGEYELGFKAGMGNGLRMVMDDLLMFYGDFKRIQEKISDAVRSEPRC
ncbi:hypothetical protein [Alicyclobacillus macrosporangiidus]|jgi:hypothetical protein|uniref:WXG100 family type VII secretion target n=1 Tax=Alicyclobacillus macrosporangiidus TaxID=392015 RepID=A0A1I7FTA4_9BACL|nr:hypothetical protein [Alicyclobacillus macrosporangiidus]SFU39449.1 hypothetical protein SAMN05421543_101445 [Alicyclobacillus macrosporangiidus]